MSAWRSLLVAAAIGSSLSSCTGFYKIKVKEVKLAGQATPVSAPPAKEVPASAGGAPEANKDAGAANLPAAAQPDGVQVGPVGTEPYAVLVAYANFDAVVANKENVDGSLKLLKLDANLTDSTVDPPTTSTVTLAVYDVLSSTPNEKLKNGYALLKAYPVRAQSNATLDITFVSSAIEKNLADQFVAALKTVQTAIPSASAYSQGAAQIVQVASTVLAAFESPKEGTQTHDTMTINLPPGAGLGTSIVEDRHALVLVPTYGTAAQIAKRLADVDALQLAVCSADTKKLCTHDGSQQEVRFSDYPYVLLAGSVMYRIGDPTFFWKKLPAGGNCDYKPADLEVYAARVTSLSKLLTTDQSGLENETLATARSLSSMRVAGAAEKADSAAALAAMATEWRRVFPTAWLADYHADGSPSYNQTRRTLRACMVSQGEQDFSTSPGLFVMFAKALDASDPRGKGTYQELNQSLGPLLAFKEFLPKQKITDPRVVAVVDAAIADTQQKMLEIVDRWLGEASDQGKKAEACKQLTTVAKNSACSACQERASKAVVADCGSKVKAEAWDAVGTASMLVNAIEGATAITTIDQGTLAAAGELKVLNDKVASGPAMSAAEASKALKALEAATSSLQNALSPP